MIQLIGRIVLVVCIVLCCFALFGHGLGGLSPVECVALAGALGFGAILVMSTG